MSTYTPKLLRVPLLPPIDAPDWAALMNELLQAGVPRTRIANNCRMARQTIDAVAEGKAEPKWSQGQMLLQLKRYVGNRTPTIQERNAK
ncbi:MAG TPA: hypothetical protein VK165_20270 [Azonexus sp.]|nr:hypothetical protein [Azonexus sp.]